MSTRPSNLPEWSTTDVNLPEAGIPNKSQPSVDLRTVGFDLLTLPLAEEENWWRNNVYEWVEYLDKEVGRTATAGGTVNALTATFTPAVTAYTDRLITRVRATGANTSTTPTIAYDGLAAKTIVKNGNQALDAGDIAGADHELILVYNLSNDNIELLNPAVTGGTSVVKQVITPAAKTDTFTTTSVNFVAVPGLSVSVTADDSTDRVRIRAMVNGDTVANNDVMYIQIFKDGNVIVEGDAAGNRRQTVATLLRGTASEETHLGNVFLEVNDIAGDTNAHTYQVYIGSNNGTAYINRTHTDNDAANYSRGVSSISAEVLSA